MIIFVHICFSETPKKDFLRPSTPSAPVLSDETKPLKRVAMSAKPENQKPAVLVPSGGNVRTPQNTVPTRRSSRLFGSTQVNFGKGIEFLSQTLIFLSLYLCISMSGTLGISNYESFSI